MHVPYNNLQVSESNKIYDKYSDEIVKKINELNAKPKVDDKRKNDIKTSGKLNYNVEYLNLIFVFIFYINFR